MIQLQVGIGHWVGFIYCIIMLNSSCHSQVMHNGHNYTPGAGKGSILMFSSFVTLIFKKKNNNKNTDLSILLGAT